MVLMLQYGRPTPRRRPQEVLRKQSCDQWPCRHRTSQSHEDEWCHQKEGIEEGKIMIMENITDLNFKLPYTKLFEIFHKLMQFIYGGVDTIYITQSELNWIRTLNLILYTQSPAMMLQASFVKPFISANLKFHCIWKLALSTPI